MAGFNLIFDIIGRDRASGALRNVGDESERTGRKVQHVTDDFIEFDKATARLGKSMHALGTLTKFSFGALGTQAAVGGLTALTAAIAPAAGALALLPAAGAAAAAPMAALKIGLIGVEDSLKAVLKGDPEKLAVALAKLAPAARDTVLAINAQKPAFDALRLDVQQQLFEGLSNRVQALGNTYLPILRESLRGFAVDINYATQRVADFLTMPRTASDLTTVLANSRVGFSELVQVARPLVQIFTDLAVVGSTFIPNLTGGLGDASVKLAEFVRNARETGQLKVFISDALSVIGQLGTIVFNVGRVIYAVFKAGQELGAGFLNTLVTITGKLADFINSARGQTALSAFFEGVGKAVAVVVPLVLQLGEIFFGTLAPALAAIAVGLAPLVQALLPLLVSLLQIVLPVLVSVAEWLGHNADAVLPLAAGLGILVLGVKSIIAGYRTWIIVQALLNTVMAANPIGLVIVVIGALVAAIVVAYQTSETFRNIVDAVFRAIGAVASWLWDTILQPFLHGLAVLWGWVLDGIVSYWNNSLKPAWNDIAAVAGWLWSNILKPYFTFILEMWITMAKGILWAWENIIQPGWEALAAGAGWLWNNILNPIFTWIMDKWSQLGNTMRAVYDHIIKPLIIDPFAAAINWLKGAFDTAVSGIEGAWDRLRGIVARPVNFVVRTVLRDGLFSAWNWVLDKLGITSFKIDLGAGFLQGIPGYAGGGQIQGSWKGPAADNVLGMVGKSPVRLNPKEYVQPVRAVNDYGLPFMESIRNGTFPKELARFASGGLVELGRRFQGMGARVSEHPAFGGVAMGGHGRSSLHYVGRAIDVNTRAGESALEQRELAPMNRLAQSLGFRTIFMSPGHFNHLHVDDGMGGSIGGGSFAAEKPWYEGLWDTITGAKDWLAGKINAVKELGSRFGAGPLTGWLGEMPGKLIGPMWDKITGPISDAMALFAESNIALMDPMTGTGIVLSGVKQQVQQVAARFGWGGGAEWAALDRIIQKESSWNPRAANPSSSARGLFQKMTSIHGPIESTAAGQAEWGLNYIRKSYGRPTAALAFHNAHGWYSDGGQVLPQYAMGTPYVPATGPAVLHEGERVLSRSENLNFARPVSVRVFIGERELTDIVDVRIDERADADALDVRSSR